MFPSVSEISKFRKPKEYCYWFQQRLENTRNASENDRRAALLHDRDSLSKKFYEELFPLAMLLEHKKTLWAESDFCPLFKSPFDVGVRSSSLPFQSIEIACTNFDNDERFRMNILLQDGHVNALGKILRDDRGLPVGVSNEFQERDTSISFVCKKVCHAVEQKCRKRYSSMPALLIYYDDFSHMFEIADYLRIENACQSMVEQWRQWFSFVFAVGPRNKQLVELCP